MNNAPNTDTSPRIAEPTDNDRFPTAEEMRTALAAAHERVRAEQAAFEATIPVFVWTSTSRNSKTGDIPTGWVASEHRAESCKGCPHFDPGNPYRSACYAWRGTPGMAARSIDRGAARNPERYTLSEALRRRAWGAQAVRLGAIGDPSAATRAELRHIVAEVAAAGLTLIGYTHHWHRQGMQWLRSHIVASVDNDAGTAAAIKAGWKVARTVDADTFADAVDAGRPVDVSFANLIPCPAMAHDLTPNADGLKPTCNDCGLCPPPRLAATGADGVAFAMHGPAAAGKRWRAIVKARRGQQ